MYDNGNTKVLAKAIQYTYDANGNQLSEYASFTHPNNSDYRRTISASVYGDNQQSAPDALIDRTLNTYDGFNRLTKVEKAEAGVRTVAEYVYNGDDLRVRKTVKKSDSDYAPESTYFLYDRQHVILETDGSGNTAVRYIRGINYIAQYSKATDVGGSGGSGTSLAYYLYNGHGDVVQTVSANGEIQNRYDYDIFGNPTFTIETTACNIRYAGEYLDNETGLYYLRARYYDPNIGRFISEDSYWGEDSNPLSLNLYTYAYNNPIRFIDPTGHSPYEDIIANARKQAQTNSIIKEINKQKDIWFKEEKGAGKNQKTWTDAQTEANRKAEALRQQLAQLESGNADIQKLIRDDSKAIAGAWEGYQLSVTARLAEANPGVDYSDTIRRQAQDYVLAEKYGRNAIGIDASKITEETRTAVERFAESVVASYQTGRVVNSFTAVRYGDSSSVLGTVGSGRSVYPGRILAYSGNDFSMFSNANSGTSSAQNCDSDGDGFYWRGDGLLQTPYGVVIVGAPIAISKGYYWREDGLYQTPYGVMLPPAQKELSDEDAAKLEQAMNELKKKAKANESLDVIQTGLDLLGMIPVVGEPIDGINAGIYFVREDYANAALSAASTLPIAGWVSTGGKFVKKSIKVIAKYGDEALEGIKTAGKNIDEVAEKVGKTQIVVNHEIGSSFDVYVEGKKLRGIAEQGLLRTQDPFGVDDMTRSVIPDYSI